LTLSLRRRKLDLAVFTGSSTRSHAGVRGARSIGAAFLIATSFELLASCGSDSPHAFHTDAGTGGTDSSSGATAGKPSSTGGTSSGGAGGVSGAPASGGKAGEGSGGKVESVDAGAVDSGTNRDGASREDGSAPSTDAGGGEDVIPPGTPDPDLFGTPCIKTLDCGPGLVCVTSSSNTYGGGMPNGLCTLDCSADILSPVDTASVCARISDTAVCAQASPTKAFCTEGCTFGSGVDPSDKCHGRKDMACTTDALGTSFCRTVCRGDFDCGGRICDLASGLCKDSLPSYRKLPIGTKCDPGAAPDPCEGVCIELDDGSGPTGIGFCSGYCRLGATPNCGASPSSSAPPTASCLYGGEDTPDLGDVAICAPLCDCNDDCASRDFICDPAPGLMAQLGRLGTCTLPSAAAGDPAGMACN
jgi:hypothetical protein